MVVLGCSRCRFSAKGCPRCRFSAEMNDFWRQFQQEVCEEVWRDQDSGLKRARELILHILSLHFVLAREFKAQLVEFVQEQAAKPEVGRSKREFLRKLVLEIVQIFLEHNHFADELDVKKLRFWA